MERVRVWISRVLMAAAVLVAVFLVVLRYTRPELTTPEALFEFGPEYAVGIVVVIILWVLAATAKGK